MTGRQGVAPRSTRTEKSTSSLERSGAVQSLMRALSLLDELAENDDGLPLTTLARSVGLPPSSAHRLLTTLQRKRFVRFDQATMAWRIGVQAFVVGAAFARSREVATLAMPYMRQLMEKTGETVNLYVVNGGHAICIAQVQSRQVLRAISRPGGGLPLEQSAAGKAILARMTKGQVEDVLSKHASADSKRSSAGRLRKLHAELGRIRARGYSLDDEQVATGLRCIAAPVLDEHGAALAAVSIAGPTSRLTDHRLSRLAETVIAASDAVTRDFGGAARPSLAPRR